MFIENPYQSIRERNWFEVEWFLYKMKIIFPDYWDNFVSILNKKEKKDILKSYHGRLINPDPKIHIEAAIAWARYEANCSTLLPNASKSIKFRDTKMALSLSRIEAHYFLNNLFLEKDQILNNIHKIRHIPGLIIQGRYDAICPPENAFKLHKAWENSKLKGVIELKSLGKSADKNINNRQEEAVGCAMLMKAGQPSVKRSYFLIGDVLKEGTKERFKTFFQLCIDEVFYHSVGSLLLDATGNYTSFERFSVNDMFDIYKE